MIRVPDALIAGEDAPEIDMSDDASFARSFALIDAARAKAFARLRYARADLEAQLRACRP